MSLGKQAKRQINKKTMPQTYLLRSLAAASLLLLAACPRYPMPENATGVPSELIDAIEARANSISDLRISAKADYWDFDKNERVAGRDVVISARLPASLRITLSSFDKALATLVSDGERFAMIDTQQSVYYEGPASPENLSQLIPLYLSARDFVRVLSGAFPVDELHAEWRARAELGWNSDRGRYRLTLPRVDGGALRIEASHPEFDVQVIEILDANGESQYVYKATDFIKIGSTRLPTICRFELVSRQVDVTIRSEKTDVDLQLIDRVFELPLPPGFELVSLP
ncbi:MAG: DUF4292 domain-containing protein [Myxococcota bacterium]|jgi:hypothetical protein|nr:DUF4292 domain-containing protein [Myxococcota bacterium]